MGEPTVLQLRGGRPEDVDLVFRWANDPTTRQVSFNRSPISYDTHLRWYAEQLERSDRNVFIAWDVNETPVALVRLDRGECQHRCIVSINVAPGERGRGIGTAALKAATPVAMTLGFRTIDAYIRPTNGASIKAFVKAGYSLAQRDAASSEALRYELDVTEPS